MLIRTTDHFSAGGSREHTISTVLQFCRPAQGGLFNTISWPLSPQGGRRRPVVSQREELQSEIRWRVAGVIRAIENKIIVWKTAGAASGVESVFDKTCKWDADLVPVYVTKNCQRLAQWSYTDFPLS